MPRSKWSNKEERQYEHIKESAKDRGKSEKRAKEVAARTVNKGRQQAGKTKNKTAGGTGNPNEKLEDRKVIELRNLASQLEVDGRSSMNKSELVNAIRKKRRA